MKSPPMRAVYLWCRFLHNVPPLVKSDEYSIASKRHLTPDLLSVRIHPTPAWVSGTFQRDIGTSSEFKPEKCECEVPISGGGWHKPMPWETLRETGHLMSLKVSGRGYATHRGPNNRWRTRKPDINFGNSHHPITGFSPWVALISAAYVKFPCMLMTTFSR